MSSTNGAQTWTLLYSSTVLSGSTNVTSSAWSTVASVTHPAPTSTAIIPLFSGLSFSIPASTTYRFAIKSSGSSINYGGSTTTTNIFTAGGVNLLRGSYTISGSAVGYSGSATSVSISPRYFCGTIYFTSIPPCSGAPTAPTITTAVTTTPICTNTTKVLTATNPSAPPGIQYHWEEAAASSGPWTNVSAGTGFTTLTYTTPALTTTKWYRVKAVCCTNSAASTGYQVAVIGAPAQPSTISGSVFPCSGVAQTYSIAAVANATSYTWTLPSGWSGSSTSNSIIGTPGNNGNISVTASNACGTSTSQTLPVTINSIPAQPASIVGPPYPCINASITYNISSVSGATSYAWTLPTGWTGTSASSSIGVFTNNNPGSIAVSAMNACGSSAPATMLVIPVTTPPAPTNITGSTSVCAGSTQTYTVPSLSGITYIWVAPAGWVGAGTGNSIIYTAGSTSGQVSVSAIGSCGTSVPITLAVTSIPMVTPSVSITIPSATMCTPAVGTFTASAINGGTAPSYQWKKNGVSTGINSNVYTGYSLSNGDVISVTMTTNATCATSATATSNTIPVTVIQSVMPGININTLPGIISCEGTPITFTSNITGGGNSPSYQWYHNSVAIPGATATTYTSSTLADNDTISAILTSSASCLLGQNVPSNKVAVDRNENVAPTISITPSQPMPVTTGTSVMFTANYTGAGPTPTLQWIKNGVVIPYVNGDTYNTSELHNGDMISVKMISSDPCAAPGTVTSAPLAITVQFPAGIANTVGNWTGDLSFYPNPSSGHFTISAHWGNGHNGERVYIDVLNTIGQSVYHTELLPDRAQWSHSVWLGDGVANGMYQLKVQTSAMRAVKPLMIQQ